MIPKVYKVWPLFVGGKLLSNKCSDIKLSPGMYVVHYMHSLL